ncbi:hypothetical protein IFM89_032457 [Coptis chinensis]|uniref:BZIP domain-containing protein n=1 Tax=Coptis chinensis TaxID=261450 RepID=A0A835I868_9MAGN|nr:hypothetical protein IFM89_032457 [Coptis chinensis]
MEEVSAPKSLKQTALPQETPSATVYPDWPANMQAYFAGASTRPASFTAPDSSAPAPYHCGSQQSNFGTPVPYSFIHPQGGLYSHPNIPVTAPSIRTRTERKVLTENYQSSINDLKGSSGNSKMVNMKSGESGLVALGLKTGSISQRAESERECSSNTSDEDMTEKGTSNRRSSDQMLAVGKNARKCATQDIGSGIEPSFSERGQAASSIPAFKPGNPEFDLHRASPAGALLNTRPYASGVSQPVTPVTMVGCEGVVSGQWILDEHELKRQRRMQSNRESARRSRLKKQAEGEDLQTKVKKLNNENNTLKTELLRLAEECQNIEMENSSIMVDLKELYGEELTSILENDQVEDGHSGVLNPDRLDSGEGENKIRDCSGGSNSVSDGYQCQETSKQMLTEYCASGDATGFAGVAE